MRFIANTNINIIQQKGAESENLKLKEHLSNLRDKLAEATESLAETTADLTKSQKINQEIKSIALICLLESYLIIIFKFR
jgi:hypothetical protein